MEAEALLIFGFFLACAVIVLMGFVILNMVKENRELKEETRMFFTEMIRYVKLMRQMYPDGEDKEENN